jgi:hypothetical protein
VPVVEVEVWDWFTSCDVDDLKLDVERYTFLIFGDVLADILTFDICIVWLAKDKHVDRSEYTVWPFGDFWVEDTLAVARE